VPDAPRSGDPSTGGEFYDGGDVFETYVGAVAPGPWSANYVMEEPALLDTIGDVQGARILDLGCGLAVLGSQLLAGGCASYLGIDGSTKMVAAASAQVQDAGGEVRLGTIEEFSAPPGSYDLIVSRMALHYVGDIRGALSACAAALEPRGRMVFSVVHPVVTSHDGRASTGQARTSWLVDDYFATGPREQIWMGGSVWWHHRTIEEYVVAFQEAGFALTALSECAPRRDRFDGEESEYERRRRMPLFLLLAGRRG
jgi:SAM-dependent methyltransferase